MFRTLAAAALAVTTATVTMAAQDSLTPEEFESKLAYKTGTVQLSGGMATIKLPELWRLGGDSEDEEEFFGVISDIDIDAAGQVYLLDSQLNEAKIYTKDGEFVRSIGREGEGPSFHHPRSTS